MTQFRYLVSLADVENFSEPERLGQLAGRLLPKLDKAQSQALGWLGHFSVGLLFAMVYIELRCCALMFAFKSLMPKQLLQLDTFGGQRLYL